MTLRLNNPGSTRVVDPSTGRNRTATHLSTNINILVEGVAVGAIQKMNVNESGQIAMIDEIGTDGHIDSARKSSINITGSCTRTRFDGQRIAEAFMRGYVHVKAQRLPFDIEIQDNFKGGDADSVVITTIRNVWIKSIGYSYSASDFVITEDMDWEAESIDSVMGSGASVVGSVNSRGIPVTVNPFERSADVGQYRGALDGAGLLNAIEGSAL